MKIRFLLIFVGLATNFALPAFTQQKEPTPSEQDRAQIVAGGGGTTRGSSALKPISQSALQSMLDTTARELLIPGAVVLLRTPQGEFTATYGTTQLGTKIPPTTDTYFRIASNTKTMTAAVIVQLAQEGKLKFSDPVSKYVAGVPNGGNITIAELLDMRSGLYNYTNAPEFAASLDRDMKNAWTPAQLLADSVRAEAQLRTGSGVRILQYQLHSAWPHHREGRPQVVGPVNARPIVQAARPAAHVLASQQRERTPRALFPRIPLRQFFGRIIWGAAVFGRNQGRGHRRDP